MCALYTVVVYLPTFFLFTVKYLSSETNMVIIRAKRDFYRLAQAALTFVKKIGEYDAFLHTVHIGGGHDF